MTITVSNLPPGITEADLTELFSEHGSIQKIEIFESENAASVELAGEQEEIATAALHGKAWHGKTLELELVFDNESRDPGGPPGGTVNPPPKKP